MPPLSRIEWSRLLGRRLRNAREQADLHQAQVARRLGRYKGWLSKVEAGNTPITPWELGRVAPLYGVRMEDLVAEPTPAERAWLASAGGQTGHDEE